MDTNSQLPEAPEPPDPTQPELKAIRSRSHIIDVTEHKLSWDPEVVTEYFHICADASDQSFLKLQSIKASLRQCRKLLDRAGIQKQNLVRRHTVEEGANGVNQQQVLILEELLQQVTNRWIQIARVRKQWIHVYRLNVMLARTAMLNMAYLKAGELGDNFLETGTEVALKTINEHLVDTRRMKTSLLISLYDALEWARLDQRDVVAEVTTVIENLPW